MKLLLQTQSVIMTLLALLSGAERLGWVTEVTTPGLGLFRAWDVFENKLLENKLLSVWAPQYPGWAEGPREKSLTPLPTLALGDLALLE